MVAAMIERRVVVAVVREDRDVCCPYPTCHRHLGSVRVYGDLPPRMVWTKRQCPSCRRWTWFDAATGEAADRPQGPPT